MGACSSHFIIWIRVSDFLYRLMFKTFLFPKHLVLALLNLWKMLTLQRAVWRMCLNLCTGNKRAGSIQNVWAILVGLSLTTYISKSKYRIMVQHLILPSLHPTQNLETSEHVPVFLHLLFITKCEQKDLIKSINIKRKIKFVTPALVCHISKTRKEGKQQN